MRRGLLGNNAEFPQAYAMQGATCLPPELLLRSAARLLRGGLFPGPRACPTAGSFLRGTAPRCRDGRLLQRGPQQLIHPLKKLGHSGEDFRQITVDAIAKRGCFFLATHLCSPIMLSSVYSYGIIRYSAR